MDPLIWFVSSVQESIFLRVALRLPLCSTISGHRVGTSWGCGRFSLLLLLLSYFSRARLCDPRDGSPPGSPVPGILQARTLEWVAISFSNAWKWKLKVKSLSHVQLLATPWTAAHQAPPSMGFSRQEYWSGAPLPSPNFSQFQRLLLKEQNNTATNMDAQVDNPLFTYWVTQDTHITFSQGDSSNISFSGLCGWWSQQCGDCLEHSQWSVNISSSSFSSSASQSHHHGVAMCAGKKGEKASSAGFYWQMSKNTKLLDFPPSTYLSPMWQ